MAFPWRESWLYSVSLVHAAYVHGMRLLALASVALAIYVIVGSWMFRDWWYLLFWGGYANFQFVKTGLEVLVDDHFHLAIGIVIGFVVVVLAIAALRRWFVPFLDRFARLIVFCAVMAVLADALVVRHLREPSYEQAMALQQALAEVSQAYQRAESLATPAKIEPPIYFRYKDDVQVEALYNQIESELQLKERTVTGSSDSKGKAGVELGGANIGVEAGKASELKSTFTASQFSPDRKCIAVMKYVSETWPANYYTNENDWYYRRVWKESFEPYKAIFLQQPIDPSSLKPIPPGSSDPEESARQTAARITQLQTDLKNELRLVHGMVFIDGDFDKSISGNSLILTRKFSERGFKCSFRIFLPKSASESLPTTKTLHLKVFGDVTRPFAEDGFVDIAAVAVF